MHLDHVLSQLPHVMYVNLGIVLRNTNCSKSKTSYLELDLKPDFWEKADE